MLLSPHFHIANTFKVHQAGCCLTAAAASAALILAASPAAQAKHITVALSAAFTTLDSYDSPDTITKPWHEPFTKGSLLLIKT